MKLDVKTLKTKTVAESALTDHRADRAANKTRREELSAIIGDAQAEMELLEDEYRVSKDDENIILRRLGQIAIGE